MVNDVSEKHHKITMVSENYSSPGFDAIEIWRMSGKMCFVNIFIRILVYKNYIIIWK